MDSAFYGGAPIAACRRADVRFSVTARTDPTIARAIAGIDEHAWTPIKYPQAIFDEDEQRWISDAQVAEVPYTAFAGNKAHAVTARLIVRRVRRLAPPAQGELLPAWRHHAIFTPQPAGDARCRDGAVALCEAGAGVIVDLGWLDRQGQLVEGSHDPVDANPGSKVRVQDPGEHVPDAEGHGGDARAAQGPGSQLRLRTIKPRRCDRGEGICLPLNSRRLL
jgi:hypothetical protein